MGEASLGRCVFGLTGFGIRLDRRLARSETGRHNPALELAPAGGSIIRAQAKAITIIIAVVRKG